jgi:hypothetical protein
MICTILALVLCFSLAISVSAEAGGTSFVIDELGYLTDNEIAALNNLGSAYYDLTGVGIFYAYVYADSAENYDVSPIVGGLTDYVVMIETEEFWFMQKSGRGEEISFDEEDAIRAIYDETQTYMEGVAAYLDATAEYFPAVPETTEAPEEPTEATEATTPPPTPPAEIPTQSPSTAPSQTQSDPLPQPQEPEEPGSRSWIALIIIAVVAAFLLIGTGITMLTGSRRSRGRYSRL